ncbi:MAG: ATP-binding protein, partial [Erysipelotrichaceae bacterium]|nr:ATP-binding protein [Erysipelotrichaceae bacterium]
MEKSGNYSIATATNVPTEKSEKFISQTIEKLLDGIVPEKRSMEYTIVLLATPVKDVANRKLRLGEFYSGLAPYAQWQTNYTVHETNSVNSTATVGVNVGASAGMQNTNSSGSSLSDSVTDSNNSAVTDSTNETVSSGMSNSTGKSTTKTKGTNSSISGGGGFDLGPVKANATVTGGASTSTATGSTTTKTVTSNIANSVGRAVTSTLGKAITRGVTSTVGIAKSLTFGGNFGMNFARSSSVTASIGKDEGIHQSFTNYNIKHTLEKLEQQMKRLEMGSALGMWDFAAYILSESQDVANNVAHSYIALTQGENSHMSESAINVWRGDMGEESCDAKEIYGYIREFRHPLFGLNPELMEEDPELYIYPSIVTATTSLSGKELAYSLNFPQKSIAGLPVIESASFGRNITTYEDVEYYGAFTMKSGTWDLNGHKVVINGDLYLEGGTIDLNGGTLTVTGNIYSTGTGGYMYIHKGTLNVGGDYLLYSLTTD